MNFLFKFLNDRKPDVITMQGQFIANPFKKFSNEELKIAFQKADESNKLLNTDGNNPDWLGYIEDSFVNLVAIKKWIQKKYPNSKIVACFESERLYVINITLKPEDVSSPEGKNNVQTILINRNIGRISQLPGCHSQSELETHLGVELIYQDDKFSW